MASREYTFDEHMAAADRADKAGKPGIAARIRSRAKRARVRNATSREAVSEALDQSRSAGSIADPFLQGLSVGTSDEGVAFAKSQLGGANYDEALAKERSDLENYRGRHPAISMGAEIAGAVAPALLSRGASLPSLFASLGGKTLGKEVVKQGVTRGAAEGAAFGGAYGFGTGEGGLENRLANVPAAAALGAAGGATGGYLAGRAAKRAGSATKAQMKEKVDALYKATRESPVRFNPKLAKDYVTKVREGIEKKALDDMKESSANDAVAVLKDMAKHFEDRIQAGQKVKPKQILAYEQELTALQHKLFNKGDQEAAALAKLARNDIRKLLDENVSKAAAAREAAKTQKQANFLDDILKDADMAGLGSERGDMFYQAVRKSVSDFMKTPEFARLEKPVQEALVRISEGKTNVLGRLGVKDAAILSTIVGGLSRHGPMWRYGGYPIWKPMSAGLRRSVSRPLEDAVEALRRRHLPAAKPVNSPGVTGRAVGGVAVGGVLGGRQGR